jgi:hypothetical protein
MQQTMTVGELLGNLNLCIESADVLGISVAAAYIDMAMCAIRQEFPNVVQAPPTIDLRRASDANSTEEAVRLILER